MAARRPARLAGSTSGRAWLMATALSMGIEFVRGEFALD
jgi:hypothetical protein